MFDTRDISPDKSKVLDFIPCRVQHSEPAGAAHPHAPREPDGDVPAGCSSGWACSSSIPERYGHCHSLGQLQSPWLLKPAPLTRAAFAGTHPWERSLDILFFRWTLGKVNFSLHPPSLPEHLREPCGATSFDGPMLISGLGWECCCFWTLQSAKFCWHFWTRKALWQASAEETFKIDLV